MAQFYSAKRRTTTRQIITVSVNDLDSFGQGVARHNGKTLFIPGLLPQENAEVTVTEDKKQYARAKVVRRLSDSPERETPRCPHFGVCGGCQQQHASVQQHNASPFIEQQHTTDEKHQTGTGRFDKLPENSHPGRIDANRIARNE